MYRYEYVTLDSETLLGARFSEHQQVIDAYAAKGWRFVAWVPVRSTDYGKVKKLDLVFEKEV